MTALKPAFLLLSAALPALVQFIKPAPASAEGREFIVCTQNLHRLASPEQRSKGGNVGVKRSAEALAERIIEAGCDAVGVQEVYGRTVRQAEKTLERLTKRLWPPGGWGIYVAESGDRMSIRNGFLIRKSRLAVHHVDPSFTGNIPKLREAGPLRYFNRTPIGLVVSVNPGGAKPAKKFYLISAHLKSKAKGFMDRSGTDFELLRMELAGALREYALRQSRRYGIGEGPIIMIDRNSNHDTASAQILSGVLRLEDFRPPGGCRLEDDEVPSCPPRRVPDLVPLLAEARALDPAIGSFARAGRTSLIDDILVAPQALEYFKRKTGGYDAGTGGKFGQGSDHLLLWGALNW